MSFNDGGHWYFRDGTSCHEVPLKTDPSRKRNTTIKDAKDLGLVPSVTTVMKATKSPALDAWKQRQVIEACYNNKNVNLPLDQWSGMVTEAAFASVGKAADDGEQYHLVVESVVRNEELPDYELTIPPEFFSGFCKWWHEMGVECDETEVNFAHPSGYGGRMDFVGHDKDNRDVFIDWKTRDTKGKTTLAYYRDSMPVQLAAYMNGYAYKISDDMLFLHDPRLISVIISRDEPGRVEHHEWPDDDHKHYLYAFNALFDWWKYVNQYDPAF